VAAVRLVADTHSIVWWLVAPRKLGAQARRAFEAADAGRWLCCIPVITLVEIALLRERGRIAVTPQHVLQALAGQPGYAILAADAEQALEFAGLIGVKDPIDRLVLAAARATAARLVSIDAALDGFGVRRVWD
jgi:PIN domain nuclease of toxin-antitoxin system